MIVDELNRIFHCHDMAWMDGVTVVDHGGEGRGFSGTGGSDDQHQPAHRHGDVFHNRRQAQLLDGLDLGFDMPEDQADVPSLPKNIDTKTAEFLVVEGQVHFHFFLEFPTLLTAHQRQRKGFELFIGKRRRVGLLCRAVDAKGGSRVDGQVQVRRFFIHHDFQETANIHRYLRCSCQVY